MKNSLLIDLHKTNAEQAQKYGVPEGTKLMEYDFVLVSEEESRKLREQNAMQAMEAQGRRMKLYKGLPVPDLD